MKSGEILHYTENLRYQIADVYRIFRDLFSEEDRVRWSIGDGDVVTRKIGDHKGDQVSGHPESFLIMVPDVSWHAMSGEKGELN